MKKVLLTINNNRLSGIENFTLLLAKYLDSNLYEVEVGIPTEGPICEIFDKNKIEYFVFDNKVNEKHTLSGVLSLFRRVLKKKYDIIHAQAGIAPCLIGKITGTKLIIEHKHGLDFTTEQLNEMNFLKLNYERMKKYLVDITFTGCMADKQVLINKFKYRDEKVVVIYNGIEKSAIVSDHKRSGRFKVGTIGRLTYQKGQEYLIEAARILISKGFDFEFHIYGEGEKFHEYSDLISKYDLGKNIFLKGYALDVPQIIATFDLFILPSRYEGIPYVILEAMKAKVPLISTDVGGIREIITDMENGILIQKENAEELANKIYHLYESEDLRNKLAEKAFIDFNKKYQIGKTVESIETVYSA